MNILFYQWKAYNGKDIEANLRLLGCKVAVFSEEEAMAGGDEEFLQRFGERLKAECPDLVFSVDFFPLISRACQKEGIPYVSWSCDGALTSLCGPEALAPCNYLFLFDRTDYLELKGRGAAHAYHLPLGAAADRIEALLKAGTEGKKEPIPPGDITFVGSLYAKNQYDVMEKGFSPYLKGYLDACIEAQLNVSGGNLLEYLLTPEVMEMILRDYRLEAGEASEASSVLYFIRGVLGFKTAREERLRILKALGQRFSTVLYSREAPPDAILRSAPGLLLEPEADYWTETPFLYKNSRINLNITIPNIASGVPLRVFDILMSGGFLMTNDRAELHNLFEPGKDLVLFDGIPQLIEGAEYYLAHEEERKTIAEHGKDTVRRQHSLRQRLQEILQIMEEEKEERT